MALPVGAQGLRNARFLILRAKSFGATCLAGGVLARQIRGLQENCLTKSLARMTSG